ncbi:hypothetical protein EYF80_005507 [Liparis tanakae]|uniref:Uncharacterized protein n=1 Tax=Liparis tanakae TaxID=230148 RepID=A0A4Z2J1P5_9TELE|nr:hypothetical protein EYF80_005507 [Liparis tanakae]
MAASRDRHVLWPSSDISTYSRLSGLRPLSPPSPFTVYDFPLFSTTRSSSVDLTLPPPHLEHRDTLRNAHHQTVTGDPQDLFDPLVTAVAFQQLHTHFPRVQDAHLEETRGRPIRRPSRHIQPLIKIRAISYHGVLSPLPDGLQSGGAQRRDDVSQRLLLGVRAGFGRRELRLSAVRRLELGCGDVLPVRVGVGVLVAVLVVVRVHASARGLVRPGVVDP